MRVSVSWLGEHLDASALPATAEEVGEAFVRVGLEVEEIHPAPDVTGPLTVGRVEEIEELTGFKKPIRYCQVVLGRRTRGVVCGATNFAVGDLVVVAEPGAVLPGGFAIASRETYGHTSDGMIASARELGLGADHSGILVLPPGTAEPGDDATRRARPRRAGDRARGHAGPRLLLLAAWAGARARHLDRRGLHRPDRPDRGARGRGRRVAGPDRGPRPRPALRRPAGERRRPEGPDAVVDATTADHGRDAPHLADRRRHELRDARPRPAAARVRRRAAPPARSSSAGRRPGRRCSRWTVSSGSWTRTTC